MQVNKYVLSKDLKQSALIVGSPMKSGRVPDVGPKLTKPEGLKS